jgi:two-component system, sensor histidine kinase and response regulator
MKSGSRPLRVLVAEDNLINQKIALELIRQAGHQPSLAQNGREALALAASARFDLILMDLNMPEMDGLEATRRLRESEKASNLAPTPVIALTATAAEGEREACFAAGMNDILVKPIRSRDLVRLLDPASQASPEPAAAPRSVADGQRMGKLMALFQQEGPRLLADLQTAVHNKDAQHLRRAAHSLAGTLAYLPPSPTMALVRQLEALGHSGSVEGAETLFEACSSNLQKWQQTLLAEQQALVTG